MTVTNGVSLVQPARFGGGAVSNVANLPSMSERVVIGMSGGVDSSLAAALLSEAGHEVVGVSMKLWPCGTENGSDPEDACCSPSDARAVALRYNIAHYVVDFETEFRRSVVDGFLAGYEAGDTPNPCIACNESLKFGDLWNYSQDIGATAVATGHYARIASIDGRLCPAVPADHTKDQTYFLFFAPRSARGIARFPLGDLTKEEVRKLAAERGFHNADKEESMDLCFVGDSGLQGFLREELPQAFEPGAILLDDGREIGQHKGAIGYTIGQRKGLGVAWTEPLYVVGTDVKANTVTLATRDKLTTQTAWLRNTTWHLHQSLPELGLRCLVRNRHHGRPIGATIHDLGNGNARIDYDQPITLPSPGQAAVAYDQDLRYCLGGGWFSDSVE